MFKSGEVEVRNFDNFVFFIEIVKFDDFGIVLNFSDSFDYLV